MRPYKSLNIIEIQEDHPIKRSLKSKVLVYYRNYLKRFVIIAKAARFVNKKILPLIQFAHLSYFSNAKQRYSVRKRLLIKQSDFVHDNHLKVDNIFEEKYLNTIMPVVYPIEDKRYLLHPEGKYKFPNVYIALINAAQVYGNSNFVFHKNNAIYHDLYNFNHDYTSEELHRMICITPKNNTLRLLTLDKAPLQIKKAATFLDATASNYAHWLSEVLPRIAVFCSRMEYRNIPIVINQGLHKNILDSLSFILDENRVVYTLPRGKMIAAETLYLTSATGYVPFDTRAHKDSIHRHDGMFSSEAIKLMRYKILKNIEKIKNDKALPKKVLVMRNSTARGVQNITELKEILMADGFEIVEPEKLSFIEQVQVFNNADHIVAPTGAALGSAIFCSPSAKVTVMMGKHKNMIYRYWAEMLQSVGCKLSYLLGEIVGDQTLGIHGDYIIDKNDLISLLENAENK